TARKIVAGRPYAKVDDLARAGVPERTIDAIRPMVTVGPPPASAKPATPPPADTKPASPPPAAAATAAPATPVDINTAGLAELETLPGIGPTLAKSIVAGRPYKTVDELARVKGLGQSRLDGLKGLVTASAPASPAAPVAPATPAAKAAR